MRIFAKHLLTPSGWRESQVVEIENGMIRRIDSGTDGDVKCECLTPGLFDVHAHGGEGFYYYEPDRTLLELVDDIRHKAGAPGIRSSGLRCPWHNRNSGGAATSKHLTGKALDFCIQGMPGARLLALAQADSRTSYAYQIKDKNGNLTDFVHVDVE